MAMKTSNLTKGTELTKSEDITGNTVIHNCVYGHFRDTA
jgi:hypothetical protein